MPNTPGSWVGKKNHRLFIKSYLLYEDAPESIKNRRKLRSAWYECVCDCGRITYVATVNIKATKSCGCLSREVSPQNAKNYGPLQKDRDMYLAGRIYQSSKHSAIIRGLCFEITKEDIYKRLHEPCEYCGAIDTNIHNAARRNTKEVLMYNGLDRVNPNIGYTIDNIVPCCGMCNTAKLDHSLGDFSEWVCRVYKHMNKEV